jgi:hypothetical protein
MTNLQTFKLKLLSGIYMCKAALVKMQKRRQRLYSPRLLWQHDNKEEHQIFQEAKASSITVAVFAFSSFPLSQ